VPFCVEFPISGRPYLVAMASWHVLRPQLRRMKEAPYQPSSPGKLATSRFSIGDQKTIPFSFSLFNFPARNSETSMTRVGFFHVFPYFHMILPSSKPPFAVDFPLPNPVGAPGCPSADGLGSHCHRTCLAAMTIDNHETI